MNLLEKLIVNPKLIFKIDALGALLTTVSLLVIAKLETYFGMPSKILYILSGVTFCFFMYSISCFRLIKSNWKPFLIIIIVCNSIYVLVSSRLIIMHSEKLTKLGWVYFILEIIVIALVVILEYKSYSNQIRN